MKTLTLFAYSFAHKKTHDFLTWLKVNGFDQVCVVAAPKVELGMARQAPLFASLNQAYPGKTTAELCQAYGYPMLECPHDDKEAIHAFVQKHGGSQLALISGARILGAEVIDLFEQGVINFHPGPIPESSGLDSMYWMIAHGARPGTTVHFIDARVDAGERILFQPCPMDSSDDIRSLQYKLYQCQLDALTNLLSMLKSGEPLPRVPMNRPSKNPPMSRSEKLAVLEQFDSWLHLCCDEKKAS